MTLTAFISGPLTAADPELMRHRRTLAEAFGVIVRSECECDTFVPHTDITEPLGMHGEDLWQWAMGVCLARLEQCDLIVMMPGWNHSRGSRLEHEHACTRGIPVAYSVEEAVAIVARLREGVA